MGQLVQGVVVSVDKKRGTVGLKASPSLVASAMVKEYAGLTLELLTPGSMVHARVRAVTKNGLLLSFLTYFTGTVDIFHLETPLPGPLWSEKYSENQRVSFIHLLNLLQQYLVHFVWLRG
jgi:rRNA biogenesis protein RRP5